MYIFDLHLFFMSSSIHVLFTFLTRLYTCYSFLFLHELYFFDWTHTLTWLTSLCYSRLRLFVASMFNFVFLTHIYIIYSFLRYLCSFWIFTLIFNRYSSLFTLSIYKHALHIIYLFFSLFLSFFNRHLTFLTYAYTFSLVFIFLYYSNISYSYCSHIIDYLYLHCLLLLALNDLNSYVLFNIFLTRSIY